MKFPPNINCKIFALLLVFIAQACSSDKANKLHQPEQTQADTTSKVEERKQVPEYECSEITYQLVPITSESEKNKILNRYKDADTLVQQAWRKALRTLNRKEIRFMRVGESIIVPDSACEDMRAYSIFPYNYPGAEHLNKIIIIDNQYQCYGCYEYGRLVRFAAANTGKERTPTFPGRYSLVWKQRLRLSSLDSTWKMPYTFNFHQYAGNAMHEFSMPGRPVSHSCVRQFGDDAKWIYSWGDKAIYDDSGRAQPYSGTPVLIVNMFDYTRAKGGPWLELQSNKDYFVGLPDAPMEVEEALIPWCQIPKSSRGVIPNKERYINAEEVLRAKGIIRQDLVLTASVDFNLERRRKAKAKAKAKEQQRLLEEQKQTTPPAADQPVIQETTVPVEANTIKTE